MQMHGIARTRFLCINNYEEVIKCCEKALDMNPIISMHGMARGLLCIV